MIDALPARPLPRPVELVARILVVVFVAAGAGALTPLGQAFLPDALRSLANSAGGWTMVVALVIWATRLLPFPAAILGFVAFVLMLQAYSVVSGLRGFPDDREVLGMWGAIALVAGPVVGLAASWLHSERRLMVAIGAALIAAPLAAEAVYGLTIIGDTTSPVYWIIQAAIAVALLVVVGIRMRRRTPR